VFFISNPVFGIGTFDPIFRPGSEFVRRRFLLGCHNRYLFPGFVFRVNPRVMCDLLIQWVFL